MSVENIVKLVTSRKMFTKKEACNVGFDIFVVRWMKPNCIALPVPVAVCNVSRSQSYCDSGRVCTKVGC